MVGRDSEEGLTEKHSQELRHLFERDSDNFRTKFSAGTPDEVPPMKIALNTCARPVRMSLRKNSPNQREINKTKIGDLIH